jgi:pullulanase/glycogen debranching enzyme
VAFDFRLLTGFPGHHKTQRMITRLGTGTVYHWLTLLSWSAANRTSGDFYGLTVEDIEIHAKWTDFAVKTGFYKGKRSTGLFVEVLEWAGFLDRNEQGLKWHDWEEHQPYVAAEKKRIAASVAANDAKKARYEERKKKLMEGHKAVATAERLAEEEQAVTGEPESGDRSSVKRSRPFPSLPNPSQPNPKSKAKAWR